MKHEWKKHEKEIYLPKNIPALIKIPEYKYFMIQGKGNPNRWRGAYTIMLVGLHASHTFYLFYSLFKMFAAIGINVNVVQYSGLVHTSHVDAVIHFNQ